VKTNKATIKKIGGKKINFSKNFKLYVIAYDSSGNELGKSVSAHFAGKDSKKYKNPKDIKLSTKTISISAGGTANIKATVKMESGKKKALSEGHAAKLRYASSDISVATVDKSGKVTGVNPGTCTVYVYAQNGLAKKVSVTIK
ncbi:Ig-like domain (group 2), partial [Butyrivibrio sp. ob235]|uniref:Ig-like domain-containing protein n=1 Tax=Butyrivibrio sp. ob235 TaxID=1761780 RepID=UPI0008AF0BCE